MMSKYSLRLLIFSLVLGVLPSVMIGMASYSIASRDIERKVKEGNMQWLAQTEQRVEQMLKSIEKSATQFANSSLVRSSMHASYTPSDFEPVRDLSNELYNLQASDVVITQAYLINLERNWALSLNTLKPLEALEDRKAFTDYAKEPRSIHWDTGRSLAPGDSAAAAVTLVHKIPILPQTDKPQGLVVIRVAASDLQEALASSGPAQAHSYILDRSGDVVLADGVDSGEYEPVNRAIRERLETRPPEKDGWFNMTVNGREMAVVYRQSGYNGWTYVSAVAIDALTKETRKIAGMTLSVSTGILLLVMVAAFYGSRRMYRPIRRLMDVASGFSPVTQEEPASSGKDELDYIRQSIESLAVSRTRAEQQLLGQAGRLKEFFVLKLFTGQITENDDLFRSEQYGFPKEWSRLGVLALQIDNLQETRFREEDRELLLYAINNIAQEVLPAGRFFTPIILNASQVTLMALDLQEPEEVRRFLYESAECLKKHAEGVLQLKVSIGISKPFEKLADTVKAYGESLSALKSRISLGPDIIVHYGDMERGNGGDSYEYTHLKVLEERLVYALRELQPINASKVFQQILNALLHKEGRLEEHQIILLQLVARLLQLLQDQGIPARKVLEDESAVLRLFRLQTREEIQHWFESRLFVPLIRVLSERADTQYVKLADRLVKLIQERYDREITLEACAQELNYHHVYLSRIFRKEIGMTFSDYLAEYRMKMAKTMLETTDRKVSEIGERLQYKNISAFIRSFRKMYDMTPGQYREKIMKGSTE
ncbi:helix-turn-helix domain-containing protein [Gorillibacterium sp. sgz5001074]|uniref:helix-turn-helix domain-containing protein n=1 Tax=Gorillibacterium sp. sgz5001074 TaxID=3446695 RepID=UPI003F66C5F5